MKTAILLHGMPSEAGYYDPSRQSQSNEHWFPWLQHELIIRDILTQTPEWPKPYAPDYSEWLKLFNQFTVDEDTILVGHSMGAGFLVRWLSENDVKVGKVVLVAPSFHQPKQAVGDFLDFELDPNMAAKTKGLVVFYSDDDSDRIMQSVSDLRENVANAGFHEFHGHGHFVFSHMGTREFPELLEETLR